MSRIFRDPLRKMDNFVANYIYNLPNEGARYILYSTHDTQVGNVVSWLNPNNYIMNDIPFASAVFMELHYDHECEANDESCFYVKTIYNGEELSFDFCVDSMSLDGTRCNYLSFRSHMDEIMVKGDLNAQCLQEFQPIRVN